MRWGLAVLARRIRRHGGSSPPPLSPASPAPAHACSPARIRVCVLYVCVDTCACTYRFYVHKHVSMRLQCVDLHPSVQSHMHAWIQTRMLSRRAKTQAYSPCSRPPTQVRTHTHLLTRRSPSCNTRSGRIPAAIVADVSSWSNAGTCMHPCFRCKTRHLRKPYRTDSMSSCANSSYPVDTPNPCMIDTYRYVTMCTLHINTQNYPVGTPGMRRRRAQPALDVSPHGPLKSAHQPLHSRQVSLGVKATN